MGAGAANTILRGYTMTMPPDRASHAITYLTGEVHALFMFCQMVAKLHPNHPALLAAVDEIHQKGIASIAPEPVPEATIEGFEFVVEGLRKMILASAATSQ
jgi:hypothetical protein